MVARHPMAMDHASRIRPLPPPPRSLLLLAVWNVRVHERVIWSRREYYRTPPDRILLKPLLI